MATPGDIRRARRRAVGGKRDRCRRGKPCSAACVARWKTCLSEMPAPVQGAIPRAIAAIQKRKERLTPKERRQAQQKRKEFVRGKVVESAKLRAQRSEFIRKRNSLTIQLKRAIIAGDAEKEADLRSRIKSADKVVGQRLKVPQAKEVDADKVRDGFRKAGDSYYKRISNLIDKMVEAANPTERGARPDRQLYDKLEGKLNRFLEKDTSLGSGTTDIGIIKSTYSGGNFKKGWHWDRAQSRRVTERRSKIKGIYNDLLSQAKKAAEEGDLRKYRDIERKFLKIEEKAGRKVGFAPSEKAVKGEIWKDVRLTVVLVNMRQAMDDALSAGDLNRFNNLEKKYIKVRDKYISKGWNRDKLYTAGGGPRMLERKGEARDRYVSNLKREMLKKANSRDRRGYNDLEKKLLKLDPNAEAGKIWKKSVQGRVNEYAMDLRDNMNAAIKANNRREYNKFERILLRLDPEERKGRMWRAAKIDKYLPILEQKMRQAAIDGNRKQYDKLERVFERAAEPANRPFGGERGAVWRAERADIAAKALKREMDEAVNANDRARYDRAEAKILRMQNTIGISDPDLAYANKGEYWGRSKVNQAISSLRTSLNEGKREGVEDISISGDAGNFSVTSRVLGNRLGLSISPNQSTSFTVNGYHTASDDLSRREIIAIIREVTRQYEEVMRRMEDDTVFRVSAAEGDGREDMRVKAYTSFGFSYPDSDGFMFGVVRNGKVKRSDEDEYYKLGGK